METEQEIFWKGNQFGSRYINDITNDIINYYGDRLTLDQLYDILTDKVPARPNIPVISNPRFIINACRRTQKQIMNNKFQKTQHRRGQKMKKVIISRKTPYGGSRKSHKKKYRQRYKKRVSHRVKVI